MEQGPMVWEVPMGKWEVHQETTCPMSNLVKPLTEQVARTDTDMHIWSNNMYIHAYLYIHTYIHACMHACMHTHVHTHRFAGNPSQAVAPIHKRLWKLLTWLPWLLGLRLAFVGEKGSRLVAGLNHPMPAHVVSDGWLKCQPVDYTCICIYIYM